MRTALAIAGLLVFSPVLWLLVIGLASWAVLDHVFRDERRAA